MQLEGLLKTADFLMSAMGGPVPAAVVHAAVALATTMMTSSDPVHAVKGQLLNDAIKVYEAKVFSDLEKLEGKN